MDEKLFNIWINGVREMKRKVNQDKHPNFRKNGKLYLERCFKCDPERGRENYLPYVASGTCAWCGWEE